jgi:uncharacterized protein YkwD
MNRGHALARRLAGTALAALVAACAGAPRPTLPLPSDRLGPERTSFPLDDPNAPLKALLLSRINRDRADAGVPPVALEERAAHLGDLFCADQARTGGVGHWDVAGRAPYLRWGLGGGVDYHVENTGFFSFSSGRLEQSLASLLLGSHDKMMAETPPGDGHRRIILDPLFTHVGIGLGSAAGEFRMSEEFTRVAFEWIKVPTTALRSGALASFGGKPYRNWSVGAVEVRFEPPPRPLSILELAALGSYTYPPLARTLWPKPDTGTSYSAGTSSDFETARDGSFDLRFRLDQGAGSYVVVAYLRPAGDYASPMQAATAALVSAVP